jgi:hypothetical protein
MGKLGCGELRDEAVVCCWTGAAVVAAVRVGVGAVVGGWVGVCWIGGFVSWFVVVDVGLVGGGIQLRERSRSFLRLWMLLAWLVV